MWWMRMGMGSMFRELYRGDVGVCLEWLLMTWKHSEWITLSLR